MATATDSSPKYVVFFDIDNTLYPASASISALMTEKIRAYFVGMGMTPEEAEVLHTHYYREYGLAIRGLIKHHKIDALDFDAKCDASLPLEDVLKPDPKTRKLLEDFDPAVSRLWGLTNAYTDHAERVLKILNLRDLMEGVIYCDYASEQFTCKPEPEYYQQAMQRVELTDPSKCLFIDDNLANVQGAKALGWGSCVYFWEHKPVDAAPIEGVDAIISDLEELRTIWPFAFQSSTDSLMIQTKDNLIS